MSKEARQEDDGKRVTSFGEPLWVDALKTLGVAFATLAFMVALGAVLSLAIIAPWGRESFDCSMWCVVERDVREFFGWRAPSG